MVPCSCRCSSSLYGDCGRNGFELEGNKAAQFRQISINMTSWLDTHMLITIIAWCIYSFYWTLLWPMAKIQDKPELDALYHRIDLARWACWCIALALWMGNLGYQLANLWI